MDEIIIGIGVNDNKKTWFPTEKTCGDDKKTLRKRISHTSRSV